MRWTCNNALLRFLSWNALNRIWSDVEKVTVEDCLDVHVHWLKLMFYDCLALMLSIVAWKQATQGGVVSYCRRSFNPKLSSTPIQQILSRASKLNICGWEYRLLELRVHCCVWYEPRGNGKLTSDPSTPHLALFVVSYFILKLGVNRCFVVQTKNTLVTAEFYRVAGLYWGIAFMVRFIGFHQNRFIKRKVNIGRQS